MDLQECVGQRNVTVDHVEEQCEAQKNVPVYGETYQWRAARFSQYFIMNNVELSIYPFLKTFNDHINI